MPTPRPIITAVVSEIVGTSTKFSRMCTNPTPNATPMSAPTTGQANDHQVASAMARMTSAAIRPYSTSIGSTSIGWALGSDPPSSISRLELRYWSTDADRSSKASTPLLGRSSNGSAYTTFASAVLPSDESSASFRKGPVTEATPSRFERSVRLASRVGARDVSVVTLDPSGLR